MQLDELPVNDERGREKRRNKINDSINQNTWGGKTKQHSTSMLSKSFSLPVIIHAEVAGGGERVVMEKVFVEVWLI